MILLTLIGILIVSFVIYLKSCHRYWQKLGIPTLPPSFFVGNMGGSFFGKKQMFETIGEAYNKFQDYKYVGYYKFLRPSLIIRDPQLIGDVLVRDFAHFENNDVHADEEVDYIASRNLFVMDGQNWRTMKGLMTPMFTSGKLRALYPLLEDIGAKFVKHLNDEIDQGRANGIDGTDLIRRYKTNNIASCVFGLEANAFDSECDFMNAVQKLSDPSYINALKFMLLFMVPSIGSLLKIRFFDAKVEEYLMNVVQQTLNYRKEHNIVRNDFLDMIAQLKEKSTEYQFTDRDIVAQGASFFSDGIETSSVVMCYALAEIAAHQSIQGKLRDEIYHVKVKHGKITHEAIQEMTLLDNVLNEAMRKHPVGLALTKVCTKEYTFPPPKEGVKGVKMFPGDSILIPLGGLHADPEYFPEPNKFDPDRFNDENKRNIVKNTYLPFGVGPRACLGMRFAILQIKFGIISILGNFRISPNERMKDFNILHPQSFFSIPLNGFWFDFEKINLH